jgi:hypothetical protein
MTTNALKLRHGMLRISLNINPYLPPNLFNTNRRFSFRDLGESDKATIRTRSQQVQLVLDPSSQTIFIQRPSHLSVGNQQMNINKALATTTKA